MTNERINPGHRLSPSIVLTPSKALIDQNVDLRISELAPNQKVDIRAEIRDEEERVWQSHASYVANEAGTIDLNSDKPLWPSSYMSDMVMHRLKKKCGLRVE